MFLVSNLLRHISTGCLFIGTSIIIACGGGDTGIVDPETITQDSINQATIDQDTIDWYIENNFSNSQVVTEESGIRYLLVREGNGEVPDLNDIVSVNYTGRFLDDGVFDTTVEQTAIDSGIDVDGRVYNPIRFNYTLNGSEISNTIAGFSEGLTAIMSMTDRDFDDSISETNAQRLFSKGSKALLFIPSASAYGTRGTVNQFGIQTGLIGPNTVLLFEFEMVTFRP